MLMKKFITLLLVLTGMVCTASAAISGTVYYAINTDYTMKLWVRYGTNGGDAESVVVMSDTGKTYKGLKIYSASFSNDDKDGVAIIEFQAFDGSTYKWGDRILDNVWTTDLSAYDGKLKVVNIPGVTDYTYDETVRFVARDEVGLGDDTRSLYLYVTSTEDSYSYGEVKMTKIGSDGSKNWYEAFLGIPEKYLSTLQWYYSNKEDSWSTGKETNTTSVKDCSTKSYVSYLYAGAAGQKQNISVNEVTFYLTNPGDFSDKFAMTGDRITYDGDVTDVTSDKQILIIPDYFMNGEKNAIRSSDCWNFVYRANPGSGDDYWVNSWTTYDATAITASGSSKRWLCKPLAGTSGYHFKFNVQNKGYKIYPYIERTLPVAAEGYATFSAIYDVIPDEGLTAVQYVEAVNTGTGKITWADYAATGIKANEGALLTGTAGETYRFIPATSAEAPTTNLLKAISTEQKLTGATKYILAKPSTSVGFYRVNAAGSWVNAGTAYLETGALSARDFFALDGETTSIDVVKKEQKMSGEYYNLAGQRVAQPTKGLYIVNGKKVIIK